MCRGRSGGPPVSPPATRFCRRWNFRAARRKLAGSGRGDEGGCATSPAVGGIRGVSPRQPPSGTARFRRRRKLLGCARFACASSNPRAAQPASAAARFRRSRTLLGCARFARASSNPRAAQPASAAEGHSLDALASLVPPPTPSLARFSNRRPLQPPLNPLLPQMTFWPASHVLCARFARALASLAFALARTRGAPRARRSRACPASAAARARTAGWRACSASTP
jgi:hypothetical protein